MIMRLFCWLFGHHWEPTGTARLDDKDCVLYKCRRCGDMRFMKWWDS